MRNSRSNTFLGPFALGYIQRQYEDSLGYRFDSQVKPAFSAIWVGEFIIHLVGGAFVHAGLEPGEHFRGLDARVHLHHGVSQQFLPGTMAVPGCGIIQIDISPVKANYLATYIRSSIKIKHNLHRDSIVIPHEPHIPVLHF